MYHYQFGFVKYVNKIFRKMAHNSQIDAIAPVAL
jgi:hypothetical protein